MKPRSPALRHHGLCAIFCLTTLTAALGAELQPDPAAADTAETATDPRRPLLKVMSFNIRYGEANDGTNSWPFRRELVAETIRVFDPDLLGLQEVVEAQADFLKKRLPDYGFHGVGREDGDRAGEFVPVMYRKARFVLLDAGHFWLSETPEVPGSRAWDAALPRMLSWVMLADRRDPDRPFIFGNTHFDHRGAKAREASARLIRSRAEEVIADYGVILCGDFNATEQEAPYQVLAGGDGTDLGLLTDAYRVVHPAHAAAEATFNGWQGERNGYRIDWILHSVGFVTRQAAIDYSSDEGRTPSDHYPVTAVLRFR